MSKQACGLCGTDPARGFATIASVRYCHEGPGQSCYMAKIIRLERTREEFETARFTEQSEVTPQDEKDPLPTDGNR